MLYIDNMIIPDNRIDKLINFIKTAEVFRNKDLSEKQIISFTNIFNKYVNGVDYPDKIQLRSKFLEKRDLLSEILIDEYSLKLSNIFLNTDYYKKSDSIFIYLSFGKEFRTEHIINKALDDNKKIFVPLIRKKKMILSLIDKNTLYTQGVFGIKEPETLRIDENIKIDLAVVPGIVFTNTGYRIGYGGGFYDRYLSDFSGITIGMVFPGFIDDTFIPDTYDIPLNHLITIEES